MATYSPAVEQWRPLVAKYFPPDLVDKALYVIQHESGGNPTILGDNGVAVGLFQIQDNQNFASRPDRAYLSNPENNIKYAAEQLGAASGRWSDWGEGSSYNGQRFGALGNNPYPGDNGDYSGGANRHDSTMNYQMVDNYQELDLPFDFDVYLQKAGRYSTLEIKIQQAIANGQSPDPADTDEYGRLGAELDAYDKKASEGGQSFDDYIKRLSYENENNPALIDAQNAANKHARQMEINVQSQNKTASDMDAQRLNQESAEGSQAAWRGSSAFSSPLGFRVGSTDLPTEEEVFAKNIAQVSKNLPEVPDIPYSKPLGAFGSGGVRNSQATGLPAGYGGVGFDVEGDTLPAQDASVGLPQNMPGGTSITAYGDGSRIGAGTWGPGQSTGTIPTATAFGAAQSAFGPPGDMNPLLTRMQRFNPPVAGPPNPLKTATANTGRRFIGNLLGRFG